MSAADAVTEGFGEQAFVLASHWGPIIFVDVQMAVEEEEALVAVAGYKGCGFEGTVMFVMLGEELFYD
jgi:hypothetical protein